MQPTHLCSPHISYFTVFESGKNAGGNKRNSKSSTCPTGAPLVILLNPNIFHFLVLGHALGVNANIQVHHRLFSYHHVCIRKMKYS